MDILPLHIEYLLTRHDCVIVPGLGAFIATERAAYIDFESGLIHPRRREISFNSSVVTDDGLLTHSLAKRERLPYEEARKMLIHLADKLSDDLRHEGEVSLGMTGKLVIDEEGLISFKPRRSAILLDILQDLKLTYDAASVETGSDSPMTGSQDQAILEDDGMRTIRVKADRYVFTIPKRAVHAAAMLVALLTIGLSLLIPINHDNEQKASVISIEEFFRPIKPQVIKEKQTIRAMAGQNDTTAVNEPVENL